MALRPRCVNVTAGEADCWPPSWERQTAVTRLRFVVAFGLFALVVGLGAGPAGRVTASTSTNIVATKGVLKYPTATTTVVPQDSCDDILDILQFFQDEMNKAVMDGDDDLVDIFADGWQNTWNKGHDQGCW
jgi:hypothetical protein